MVEELQEVILEKSCEAENAVMLYQTTLRQAEEDSLAEAKKQSILARLRLEMASTKM